MKLRINKRGSTIITTPLIIGIGTVLISSLIVFAFNILTPYIWYEKLSSTCIKYVFVMEEYGYLTNVEKANLVNELKNQGFDTEMMTVNYTSKRQKYGDLIYLKVDYIYTMDIPIIGTKHIPMTINRESVSKR